MTKVDVTSWMARDNRTVSRVTTSPPEVTSEQLYTYLVSGMSNSVVDCPHPPNKPSFKRRIAIRIRNPATHQRMSPGLCRSKSERDRERQRSNSMSCGVAGGVELRLYRACLAFIQLAYPRLCPLGFPAPLLQAHRWRRGVSLP